MLHILIYKDKVTIVVNFLLFEPDICSRMNKYSTCIETYFHFVVVYVTGYEQGGQSCQF